MTDAWDVARQAARDAAVELRPLTAIHDADRINDVIVDTWGGQRLDREVIRALAASGNVPWGAFADGALIGFVLGWAGVDDDGLHVHSHMLAALPTRRHAGVGYALKLAQRAQALDQGITVMRWTFDPLVARNAWFNLGKLGAVVDGFARAFYGEMADAINAGERSDRFMIAWDLRRDPGPWAGTVPDDARTVLRADADGADVAHPETDGAPEGPVVFLEIPREYHELRATDPDLGRRWRDAVADAADACLDRGMLGVAFARDRSAYVFAEGDRPA
ncbi:MAG TPA: GNAT family N-acetyltransferase [Actinomycetota bacterium]|nr:GNAT family N-acetyltransferase [Actinomycetota bacterium]